MATWPGPLECAQACTPKHISIARADVLDALMRGVTPPTATANELASANAALANLNAALVKAGNRIDAVLQVAGYSLPLSVAPTLLAEIQIDLARYFMHSDLRINTPNSDEGQHPVHAGNQRAEQYLADIRSKKISLGVGDPAPPTSTSGAAYFAGEQRHWKRQT
jgi:phage gp36-like protein